MKTGWEEKELGELAELKGRIGWRGLTAKEYTKSGPLFLSVHSLNYGDHVDFRDAFHISEERYDESPEIILQEDDVLICKDGAGIGKVGIVGKLPGKATINSSLLLVRSGKNILPKFLYRCLSSPYFQKIVNSRLNGATTPHLYQRDITEFPIFLPPLPEQKRIVGILDEAFDSIATAKANAEKNLQNARALFESHLQYVFTQPGEGWSTRQLGEVCDFEGGSQPPKSQFIHAAKTGYVRFLQIRDFASEKHITFIAESKKNRLCRKEDIMIGRYGASVGKILTGKAGAYNVALMKTIPNPALLDRDFFYHYLISGAFQERLMNVASRSAQNGFSKEDIYGFPVPVPPLKEQQKVIDQLGPLSGETQKLESNCQRKLAALEALKESLLHEAFTGKL